MELKPPVTLDHHTETSRSPPVTAADTQTLNSAEKCLFLTFGLSLFLSHTLSLSRSCCLSNAVCLCVSLCLCGGFVQLVRRWSSGGNRPEKRQTTELWSTRSVSSSLVLGLVWTSPLGLWSSAENHRQQLTSVRWCIRKISRWSKCWYHRWKRKWMSRESPKRWGRVRKTSG